MFQELGHTIFEGLWNIKHDLIVFSLFTNRLRYLPHSLYKYKTVHSWTRTLVYSPNFFPSSLTSRVANCLPVENLISETIFWKCYLYLKQTKNSNLQNYIQVYFLNHHTWSSEVHYKLKFLKMTANWVFLLQVLSKQVTNYPHLRSLYLLLDI